MSTKRKNNARPAAANDSALETQAQIKFQQAIAHHQNGQLEQAKAIYEAVLKVLPRHFDALHLLGAIASQTGNHQQAAELIGQAITIHPNNPGFYSNRGVSLQELGQLDAAIASYDHAIRLKPDYALAYFNRGVSLHGLKRLEDALASYDETIRIKPDYTEAYFSRGNALTELGRLEAAVDSYDQAVGINQDYAEAWSNRGFALHELKQPEAAVTSYDRAISLNPNYQDAYYNRGNALKELKRFEAAIESYEHAISLNPEHAEAWSNRGAALKALNRFDSAMASYEQAVRIKPEYAEAHNNHAVLLKEFNQLDLAIASCDRAISLRPDYPEAYLNKSLTLLLGGNFSEGWELYESRWMTEKAKPDIRHFSKPLWLGKESLTDKTVLLYHEQGLGDTIQFARYAKLVSDLSARVILEIPASLAGLFKKFSGIDTLVIKGEPLPDFDYHCPLLSLPLAFKTDLYSIPNAQKYLPSDHERQQYWTNKLGEKSTPRVGLVWSGNADHVNDHNRSIPLADLLQHLPSGMQYISLQKDVRDSDKPILALHKNIIHLGDELRDFSDTAALCELMDLVISVDTSVAHLSGMIGRPTWIPLPFSPDWRWLLNRDDSPWYSSVKLYRQPAVGDMGSVFAKIGEDLLRFAGNKDEKS